MNDYPAQSADKHTVRNVALGLFHFNPHWAADSRSAYRHCSETLGPFLSALDTMPYWRVSLEISGSGLEFVKKAFPIQLRLIHQLTERGQVELISSLYTPNIWVAFPRRDLLRSVHLNRKCLNALGLKAASVFFAQEAFFGQGVSTLADEFALAVCKDDYLSYFFDLDYSPPLFDLHGMPVLVASGHILNQLSHRLREDPGFADRWELAPSHRRHLTEACAINRPENFPAVHGSFNGVSWLWYHCGDGNHFGTIHKPDDLARCYFDPIWSRLVVAEIETYHRQGIEFCTISEFAAMLGPPNRVLPPVVEGSWNAAKAEGIRCWMGRDDTDAENDTLVLSAAGRARQRIVEAESVAEAQRDRDQALQTKLDTAWTAILNAQISDSLGWAAGSTAISFSLRSSDQAVVLGTQILEEFGAGACSELRTLPPRSDSVFDNDANGASCAPVIFGGEGSACCVSLTSGVTLWELDFRAREPLCGVRFPLNVDEPAYCPSALEESPARIPLSRLKPTRIAVPLANGLLQLAERTFVIKDVARVHVAATIDRNQGQVEFAVSGSHPERRYLWRYYIVMGDMQYAVRCANIVNQV